MICREYPIAIEQSAAAPAADRDETQSSLQVVGNQRTVYNGLLDFADASFRSVDAILGHSARRSDRQ